jgi:hypothetical protein
MAFSEQLKFIITATGTDAIKGFKDVGSAADTHLSVGTTATSKLGGALDGLAQKSPLVGTAFAKMGTDGTALASTMGTLLPGAALAAGAGIAAFGVKAIGDFQALAGSVLDFQRVVGTSAEESSAFVAVLDDYAISAEAGGKAIFKMADIAGSTPEKFAKYGVEVAKNADGTTNLEETLLNAAEAYQNTGDDATKAALLMDLFGRRGADLIPILEKGKDGADGLAEAFAGVEGQQILSQDQLDQAEDTRLALDRLGDAANELTLMIGSTLSPALGDVANSLAFVTENANALLGPIGGLGDVMGHLISPLPAAIGLVGDLTEGFRDQEQVLTGLAPVIEGLTGQMESAATIAGGDWPSALELSAEATEEAAESAKLHQEALERETKALQDASKAILEKVDSARAAVDATFAAQDAADDYTAALGEEGAQTRDVVRAATDLADAETRVAEETAEAAGSTLDATGRLDAFNGSMLTSASTASGTLRQAIVDYIAKVNEIPAEKASEILALINEGKLAEAQAALNDASRSRESTITADAHTANAEANLNHTARDREARIKAVVEGIGDIFGKSATTASPVLGTRSAGMGAGGGAPTFAITVNAGLGSNGTQIGNEIVNAIKAYEKVNGSIWRQN